MEVENWLHQYRKLDRDKDILHFASAAQSTNFADSRLKFRRNFLHLVQKLYLVGSQSRDKQEQFLLLLHHLIRHNNTRQWDVLQNHGFLQIVTYAYLHVMEDTAEFKNFTT